MSSLRNVASGASCASERVGDSERVAQTCANGANGAPAAGTQTARASVVNRRCCSPCTPAAWALTTAFMPQVASVLLLVAALAMLSCSPVLAWRTSFPVDVCQPETSCYTDSDCGFASDVCCNGSCIFFFPFSLCCTAQHGAWAGAMARAQTVALRLKRLHARQVSFFLFWVAVSFVPWRALHGSARV